MWTSSCQQYSNTKKVRQPAVVRRPGESKRLDPLAPVAEKTADTRSAQARRRADMNNQDKTSIPS